MNKRPRPNITRKIYKITSAAFAIFILVAVSSCLKGPESPAALNAAAPPFNSFRDIPGVTDEEIAAIEALQKKT